MNKIKLLLFSSEDWREYVMQELASSLTATGKVECKIMRLHGSKFLPSNIFPSYSLWSFGRHNRELINTIDTFKPDFAFVETLMPEYLSICQLGVPLLVHLRMDYLTHYTAHRKIYPDKLHKKPFYKQALKEKHRLLNNAAAIFAVSDYIANIANKKYPNKIITFYHGINPDVWKPGAGMDLKHPSAAIVQNTGTILKCGEMLVLEKVLKTFPEMTFYWAGGKGKFEDMMRKTLQYKNFVHLGSITQDNVRKLLAGVDMYILASGADALPVSVLEAQCMQKPVIATNVGGVPEELEDGRTGFLVEKGNPDQIIEKIRILLDDPQKAKAMGEAGRELVKKRFNWNIIANILLNYIENYGQKHK